MRRTNLIAVVIAIAALIAAGYAIYEPYTVRQDAAAVQSQAKSLADQVAEACAKGGAAAAQLGQACAKAAEVQGQPDVGQATAQVDPELLRAAARAAVVDYCATRNQCRGSDGSTPNFDAIVNAVVAQIPAPKDGHDGRDAPTPDWAAQVAAYCGQANEPCRGPAGTKGETGDAGATGATGAAGAPGPTCPPGYELHDAVITDTDGSTYQGKACVDPATKQAPNPLPIPAN